MAESTATTRQGDRPACPCCTADPTRRAALERLKRQRDHLAVCRWLHQLAPLTEYYRERAA
jgi:hypothetical protein